ncbi:MAG: hypothetical protein JO235_07920 [Chroococcidiopsidaceae cyanobacterium CP_BM_RX_35]|nr:hypothetical protein [Chroococcidiopsidaceae cyanobacterium CP_BM_RX_35]
MHPAEVYLAGLGPGSRRTIRSALNAIASMLTSGTCDARTLDWSALRYQHTAVVRAVLMEKYSPAMANKMLCALRRTLKEARRRLRSMAAEDYDRAVDIASIKGTRLLRGRALSDEELVEVLMEACTSDPTLVGVRDAAMLAILMVGLRRSEVVNLDLKDFRSFHVIDFESVSVYNLLRTDRNFLYYKPQFVVYRTLLVLAFLSRLSWLPQLPAFFNVALPISIPTATRATNFWIPAIITILAM